MTLSNLQKRKGVKYHLDIVSVFLGGLIFNCFLNSNMQEIDDFSV